MSYVRTKLVDVPALMEVDQQSDVIQVQQHDEDGGSGATVADGKLTIGSGEEKFKMAASRRLQKELADLKSSGLKSFREIVVDEQNVLFWTGLIVPTFSVVYCHVDSVNYVGDCKHCVILDARQCSICTTGMMIQENPPYNKGAFRIEINFPPEYPFKPPKIGFKTKIYHPNVDEKGQVCLPIISTENWKPATKTEQVIQALIALVNDPEPEHPLRADLAEEYLKDRKRFLKNAEEFTRKHSEKRPSE